MPRGKKKTEPVSVIIPSDENAAEVSAEIAAPVEVKAAAETKKTRGKQVRKPKAENTKAKKSAAAKISKSDEKTAIAETTDTEKSESSTAAEKTDTSPVQTAAKSASQEKKKRTYNRKKSAAKTDSVTVRNDETADTERAESSTAAEKADISPVQTAEKAAPHGKKKRAYNRKKSAAKTDSIVIQSGANEYAMQDITDLCKNAYRGGTRKQIKSIKVYLKAENNGIRAYYVVNDSASGHIDL